MAGDFSAEPLVFGLRLAQGEGIEGTRFLHRLEM